MLRELRIAAGLTQRELAARIGVSAPAVTYWERHGVGPKRALIPALAAALGVDADELEIVLGRMPRWASDLPPGDVLRALTGVREDQEPPWGGEED